jgi:hypothetical protein
MLGFSKNVFLGDYKFNINFHLYLFFKSSNDANAYKIMNR